MTDIGSVPPGSKTTTCASKKHRRCNAVGFSSEAINTVFSSVVNSSSSTEMVVYKRAEFAMKEGLFVMTQMLVGEFGFGMGCIVGNGGR
ncbi:hypothetical protein P8452_16771 [Trifolium repens]|nr:hypothetical protein P8452_16771 [Trifolium repens]